MKKGEKIIILIVALVCLAGCGTDNGKATESVVEESSVQNRKVLWLQRKWKAAWMKWGQNANL